MRHNRFVTPALILACGGSVVLGAPPVVSTFDTDDEGWSTDKDARNFRWEGEGGNPGGNVAADDVGTGQYWRFDAPAPYLGDKSSSYGESISYDIRQLGTVGTVTNQPDVRLTGAGITLEYRFGVAPGGDWSSFSVQIAAGIGWTRAGSPATEADIRAVLADLTHLSIRGEYRVGADSAALDNVSMGRGCAADFDGNGLLNFFDVSAFIAAYNNADPAADLAAPFGTFNFFDISAYIAEYNAGC
tara:strand:+ start:17024 stop:17755 length:732 start_codon:yes stop_codon:yes gene_type:complete